MAHPFLLSPACEFCFMRLILIIFFLTPPLGWGASWLFVSGLVAGEEDAREDAGEEEDAGDEDAGDEDEEEDEEDEEDEDEEELGSPLILIVFVISRASAMAPHNCLVKVDTPFASNISRVEKIFGSFISNLPPNVISALSTFFKLTKQFS